MLLSHQIQVELSVLQFNDFGEFLSCHQKVNSFQQIENSFHIHVVNQDKEEYSAFVEGIRDSFQAEISKEVKLCQSTCRDGTLCLNPANGKDLCKTHDLD